MANFGGHYPYSYDAYPQMTEDEEEEEDEIIDIKPLLVGGVLRPNPLARTTQVTQYNFEPTPSTSRPPPLHPSPHLIQSPQTSCSSSQFHGGSQRSPEAALFPSSYDDDVVVLTKAQGLGEDDMRNSQAPRFDCRFCDRHFTSDSNRAIHEQTHSRDHPFVCSYCGRTFSFKHSMLRHERTMHRDEVESAAAPPNPPKAAAEVLKFQTAPEPVSISEVAGNPYCSTSQVETQPPEVPSRSDLVCKLCGSRCMNQSALVKHEKMHTGEPAFRCSFCPKGFSFKETLIRHEQNVHSQEILAMSKTSPTPAVKVPAGAPNVPLASGVAPIIQEADLLDHQCRFCGKVWRNREYLKIHLRTHTGEKPFKCSYCDIRFSVRTNMQRHERSVHRKEIEETSASIQEPRKNTVDGPKAIPRSIPNFVDPHDVSLVKFDTKLNGFPCSYCSKTFPERDRLKIHVRTHTGEKPYKCKHCHMCFSVRGNRNRHEVRVHRGLGQPTPAFEQNAEKCLTGKSKTLFKCSYCDEAFNNLSLVVKHERRKHFKLRIQNSAAPCKVEADQRKRTYECCFCFQQFNHVGNMYKHQRRMHAQQFIQEGCSTSTSYASQSLIEVKSQEKRYLCNHCNQSFDSQNSVLKHEASEHMRVISNEYVETISLSEASQPVLEIKTEISSDTEEMRIRCTFCEETFTQRSQMHQHLTQVHAHLFPDGQGSSIISPPAPKKVKLNKFTSARLKTVERKEQFKCGYCNLIFKHRWNAIEHENLAHPTLLPQEDVETPRPSIETKAMQERQNCHLCEKSFTLRTNLLRHMKQMHTSKAVVHSASDNRPLPNLKRKRRSLKCPYCEKTLVGLWGWRKHLHRKHLKSVANEDAKANQKSFKCSFCTMTFTRGVIWRRHEVRKHFQSLSERSSVNPSKSLQPTLEIKNESKANDLDCSYCNKTFLSRSAKFLHERRTHASTSISQATPEAYDNTNDSAEKEDLELNRRHSDGMISKSINYKHFDGTKAINRRRSDESALKSSCQLSNKSGLRSEPVNQPNLGSTSSKYRCQYCGLQRLDRYRLIVHERTHTGERPFKCSLCGKGFAERFVMNRHKREVHFKERSSRKISFTCQVCPMRLNSAIALQQHERLHAANLPCACNFCGRTFATTARLNRHKGAMHKGYRRFEDEQPFDCDLCGKYFPSEVQLNQHRDAEHPENYSVKEEQSFDCDRGKSFLSDSQLNQYGDAEHQEEDCNMEEESFDCDICGKSFPAAGRLSRHKGAVHKGYRRVEFFSCDFCPKSFPTAGRLGRHKRTVHKEFLSLEEQSFDCDLCEESFLSPDQLSQHKDTDHKKEDSNVEEQELNVESYDCDLCEKSFSDAGRLSRHKGAVHKGYRSFEEQSFDCDLCEKSFLSSVQLSQHKDTDHQEDCNVKEQELNVESYDCDLCEKSFPAAGRLSRHKGAVHKGYRSLEKQSFDCDLCEKSFPDAGRLSRHKGAVHKGYRSLEEQSFDCDLCEKSFLSPVQLNQHKDADHQEEDCNVEEKLLFDCNLCDKSYSSARSLIQHRGAKHKGENRNIEEKQPFNCDLCSQFFICPGQLSQHKEAEHKEAEHKEENCSVEEEKSLYCHYCEKSFPSADSLIQHKVAKHKENLVVKEVQPGEQSFNCNICEKSFISAIWLNLHRDAEHKEENSSVEKVLPKDQSFGCNLCGKPFRSAVLLNQHKNAEHKKENCNVEEKLLFDCDVCAKSFSTAGGLHRHKGIVHKEYRRVVSVQSTTHGRTVLPARSGVLGLLSCTFCGIRFRDRHRLRRHLQQHTGNHPFGCSICGRRFSCSQFLLRHKREFHERKRKWRHRSPQPFACTQCCLTFVSESRLKAHLTVHSGSVKFTCDVCGACFRAKSSFYDHKKVMHK